MKKFNITTQLMFLVFMIMLLTSGVFMVISYFSINNMAEDQTYQRLQSSIQMIDMNQNMNQNMNPGDNQNDNSQSDISKVAFRDMNVYYVKKTKDMDDYKYNNAVGTLITTDEFNNFLSEIKSACENRQEQPNNIYIVKGHTDVSSGRIYYFCTMENDFGSYTIAFSDSSFTRSLVNPLLFRLFTAFVGIIFLAVAVICAWSARITHRIRMIQNHILDLPKDKYEKAYQDSYSDEIGELSRSVEQMRTEIGKNESTKQDMLQNLSHDFKTPIAVIKSYAEAYQDGMAGPEALEVIITQADLLKKKVNRLLQYNSLEYLTKDKPFEEVHMTELVTQVVSNYKFQTELKFTLDLAPDVIFMGYLENWTTVVENIIDNAKRYAKTEIKIILRNQRLRIYNDGEPIDEQFLNSVFRPYEKGSKGQFGLGMSIVKKTVDFFGMNMHVQNEEYGGVSFIIEKPEQ